MIVEWSSVCEPTGNELHVLQASMTLLTKIIILRSMNFPGLGMDLFMKRTSNCVPNVQSGYAHVLHLKAIASLFVIQARLYNLFATHVVAKSVDITSFHSNPLRVGPFSGDPIAYFFGFNRSLFYEPL